MSEWDKRIRDHRVWAEMKSLGPIIDKAASLKGSNPETVAGLQRIRGILAYSGKRLAAADPVISAPAPLDAIAGAFSSVQAELTAFTEDKEPSHISTANAQLDGILTSLSFILGAYSPEELGELVSAIAGYRSVVSEALTDAQEKLKSFESNSDGAVKALDAKIAENSSTLAASVAALQGNLGAIAAIIESERQKFATIVSDQQGQFSTSQDARSREFTDSLRLATEGLTKLTTEYQSQFSTAQDTRSKENAAAELARQTKNNEMVSEFGKKLAEQDAEFTKQRVAFVAESTQNLAKLVSNYDEKAAKVLEAAGQKLRDVEKVAGVVGNVAVTSGYVVAANAARKGMWLWQVATVLSLITLCSLAYATLGLLDEHGGHVSWEAFAGRALLLVSLGVLAAYSGTQADKLFTSERRNRKLALELEAIGPYLAPLPEDEQNKFRLQIGERSFGRDTDIHEHRKSPASLLALLKGDEGKDFVNFILDTAGKVKNLKP
jgi:hypothetical protein